jgi:hypothetical protein
MSSYDDGPGVGTAVAIFAGVIVLIVLLSIGGWALGWWFKGNDAQLEGKVNRASYGFQQSRMDELSRQIADLTNISTQIAQADPEQAAMLKAQRKAEAQEACTVARDITQPDPDEDTWRAANCFAGALSPASSYNS